MALSDADEVAAKTYMSTTYDPTFSREKRMEPVYSDRYKEPGWVDPLDPRIQRILTGNISYDVYSYRSEPLTTISYKYYNTTTLWWVIMMFNGFLHPHDIPSGTQLRIPSLAALQPAFTAPVSSIKGRVVTI